MQHAYKITLKQNLVNHYNAGDWIVKSDFRKGKDEILFIIPNSIVIETIYDRLFEDLATLPEIDHPSERVVISFCHPDGDSYCSRVINPSVQDEINMALLGRLPKRQLPFEEQQFQ